MDDDNKLGYFFLGLGVGVAAGLLFAPKSGEETREFLRSRAGDGADFLKKRGEDLRDQASDLVDRGRETVSRHKENIANAVQAGKQAYREATAD